ncbi:hypothetical protein HBH53_240740 [Parastagonospora nodorum]|nr:hypothetical protein HBH53_240740 [Parastagonospora nodorum]KAH4118196.1 hypothetical protein HBH47_146880 [Parastagonospora nodorum]KAH4203329.1 hypothetical protein HBI95_157530 [Parastagonospora nodorum]KAH5046528.1 hypothetical protein HBH96_229920 [Parastagonospora nodorum]KAH5089601.1 hypothetical protein HBH72_226580 [Parastagonospora nodorum]
MAREHVIWRDGVALDSDDLGMSAARNIQAAEFTLVNCTVTVACSNPDPASCLNCFTSITGNPVQASCCSIPYCSIKCHDIAIRTHHEFLCG